MNINITNNQNFGWNLKTHYKLTSSAIQQIPQLRQYEKILSTSSFLPDIKLSQTSIGYNMAHYFDGKNFNAYDIVPQNASDFFFDNIYKAIAYIQDKLYIPGMMKAGYSLHFLQDMAVPLHSNPACYAKSKILQHIKYESIPSKKPELFKTVLEKNFQNEEKYFHDCFLDTYIKSSKMENPFSIPKEQWNSSVKESLENAYENTFLFLKRLAKIKDAPRDKQKEEILKDIIEHLKTNKI